MKVFSNITELSESIGLDIGSSDWFLVTQEQVNAFANVTGDSQFIHIDPEKASLTPFEGTIAHGFLSLSMLSYFANNGCGVTIADARLFINYGFDQIRFVHPVRVGAKIRAHSKLLSVDEKKTGEILLKLHVNVEIESIEKPALIADWLVMIVP